MATKAVTAEPTEIEALSTHRAEASRVSDEAVDAIIAFWLQLDPATQIEVLSRFEKTLQVELGSQAARERLIVSALHETRRRLGRSPSLREYQAMRNEHPGWMPHPRSITGWLGVRSWNDALMRLRLEPVLDGDEIEGAIGQIYSIEGVIQALRDCAADLGRPPTITAYLRWERRPDVRARPGRRPASTWVFLHLFGGFPQARVAAGMAQGEPTDAHPTESILRSSSYRLTNEQVLTDIREVAARTRGHLTATVYARERWTIYSETRASGRPRALAGVGTVYTRFGNWRTAIKAAGVDTGRTAGRRPTPPLAQLSNDEITQALVHASQSVDGPLTIDRYSGWREQQLAGPGRPGPDPPCIATIGRRFGGWAPALFAAGIGVRGGRGRLKQFSNEQLLQALREADATVPGRLKIIDYASWRTAETARDPLALHPIPEHQTICQRFGGWKIAVQRMHDSAASE